MDLVSKGILLLKMAPIKVWNLLVIGKAWFGEDDDGEVPHRQPGPNRTVTNI